MPILHPILSISFLSNEYRLKTTNPSKIIQALEVERTQLEEKLQVSQHLLNSLSIPPEDDLMYNDSEEEFLYGNYLQAEDNLLQVQKAIKELSELPLKSHPVIYTVLVPLCDAIEPPIWHLENFTHRVRGLLRAIVNPTN